MLTMCEITW